MNLSRSTNLIAYRIGSWSPACWTDLAVGISVLEGLNQTNCLIHRSSHRQIVHCDLAQHTGLVNDEEASQGMATGLQIDTIVLANLMRQIGEQGDLDVAQPAFLAGRVNPGQMGEMRVDTDANHLGVDLPEFGDAIGEGNDLRGADKGAGRGRVY